MQALHILTVGEQAQAISSGAQLRQRLAAILGAVILQFQVIKPAGHFSSQAIQVALNPERLQCVPVEVAPEFPGG